ncbi:MAG: hypothetical protein O7A63_07195 [Acidobacteria bacterium]|nr:hypothetical protein [Acidobacteriota bacterium]
MKLSIYRRFVRVATIALVAALVCLCGPIHASPRPDTEEPEKPEQEEKQAEGDKEERDEGPKRLQWSANVRFRLSASETDQSDDIESDTSEARLRLRGGLAWIISKPLDFKIRFAGSVSSEENDYSFEVDTAAPLATGEASFDELFLKWGPTQKLMIYFGRFQTQFQLKGVFPKSLDRKDSNNMRITWTDGLHLFHRGAKGWSQHLILQYNDEDHTSNILRSPLDFTDDDSRISYFINVRSDRRVGPIVQRGIDLSYFPSSLRKNGSLPGPLEDYWASVGRMSFEWHLSEESPTSILVGTSIGYAPETPNEIAFGIGGFEESGGWAGQFQVSLMNFKPGHSIGLIGGLAQAGWLTSPQYTNNEWLGEIRYRKIIRRGGLFEFRVRYREELEQLITALQKESRWDAFARFTRQF